MSKYFTNFPRVKHTGENLVDITRRVDIFTFIENDPNIFVPYRVEEDMRPEDVAYYYYGNHNYVWLVYLANEIIDPYSDWVKPQDELDGYIAKKYKTASGKTVDSEVIDWTKSTSTTDNIIHYRKISDKEYVISKDTYLYGSDLIMGFSASEWEAVRFYDYEFEKNESKRDINLVNKVYLELMQTELEKMLNG